MKKMGIVVILVFFLVGCAIKEENIASDPEIVESRQSDSEELKVEEKKQTENIIPDWILPYTELGENEKPIYLGGSRNKESFKIVEGKLKFPESNIIVTVGETYGTDRKIIRNESEKVLDIIKVIEKENIISEENAKNPNAKLLGHTLNLILVSVKSEYILVEISSFDDDRHYITIMDENSENATSVFVKSKELTQLLQDIIDYKIIDVNNIGAISSANFTNTKTGSTYKCSKEEEKELYTLLKGLEQEQNELCSGPFDISIEVEVDGQVIRMKWANDSCGLLAVEGKCYKVVGEEQEWLESLILTLKI